MTTPTPTETNQPLTSNAQAAADIAGGATIASPVDAQQNAAQNVAKNAALSAGLQAETQALENLVQKQTGQHISQEHAHHGRMSTFMATLLIFFILNGSLTLLTPFTFDQYKFPYRGWSWWTFQDLKSERQVHNVALLGSSLMVSAVSGSDARFLKRPLDLTTYHKSALLDKELEKRFGGTFSTFNLSAPGQMPSDAYLSLRAMVNTAHRPDVVIYGLAPRDFIDSSMSSPTDTEPFRFLKRLSHIDDVAPGLFRSPLGKLDWLMQKSTYFYEHSLDVQLLCTETIEKLMNTVFPPGKGTYNYWQRVNLLPTYKYGEIHPLAVIAQPQDPAKSEYKDNTKEYLDRYKNPDPHNYQVQLYFLRKLAMFCKKERIELVLVNMPITPENINILKPWIYLSYIAALRDFSNSYDVPAFEMNDFSIYKREDYHDSVHLNASGGTKFLEHVARTLDSNTRTHEAMRMAGQELKRHRSVASKVVREDNNDLGM